MQAHEHTCILYQIMPLCYVYTLNELVSHYVSLFFTLLCCALPMITTVLLECFASQT